jgi:PIN domain nuclease of toxin-antitoxin system
MRFLIDTHCWLWAVRSPDRLPAKAIAAIESGDNKVVLSVVSTLEIAIKVSIGKLQLPEPAHDFVYSQMAALSMTSLPVYLSHSLRVSELPLLHRDPFDRLLVAQCQIERIPLMTADEALTAYDIDIIWAGRGKAPHRKPN